MSYYFNRSIKGSFEEIEAKTRASLKQEGFGVLTEIDVKETLKNKLGVDFRRYLILGACNPPFAHKALLAEDKIGTMLPCNLIIQELPEGEIEVAAIDPIASMEAIHNPELGDVANEVREKLRRVVENL